MKQRNRILLISAALVCCSIGAAITLNGLPRPGAERKQTASISSEADEAYSQDFSQDDAVLSVVLANSCEDLESKEVLSSDPADPSEDGVEETGPFKEAKAAMLRRSPKYFGVSEHRSTDRIHLPASCAGLILASDTDIEAAMKGPMRGPTFKDWGTFSARFPGATSVRRVSLPGYSRDGKYAVVYTSGACGHLCGSGFSVTLKRTKTGWVRVDARTAWIS